MSHGITHRTACKWRRGDGRELPSHSLTKLWKFSGAVSLPPWASSSPSLEAKQPCSLSLTMTSPKMKNCFQSLGKAFPTVSKSLQNLETTIPQIYPKFSFPMTNARPYELPLLALLKKVQPSLLGCLFPGVTWLPRPWRVAESHGWRQKKSQKQRGCREHLQILNGNKEVVNLKCDIEKVGNSHHF